MATSTLWGVEIKKETLYFHPIFLLLAAKLFNTADKDFHTHT